MRSPAVPTQPASGPLRTIHSYANKNGSVALDIYTYPLRVPAFQGGSKARGWGSLAGLVTLNVTDTERISAVTISVTGTVRVLIPKAGSTDTPAVLDHLNPEVEEAKEHNLTILQIEHSLWQAADEPDSNLFQQGKHPFEFDIDLPAYRVTTKGKNQSAPVLLPPSWVIEAGAAAPAEPKAKPGVMSSMFKGGKEALPKNWASVKYEVHVKVHRVGLLKRNARLSAPIVFLPPPESGHEVDLQDRRRLAGRMAQIVTNAVGDGRQPIEADAPWRKSPINFSVSKNGEALDTGEGEKKSGLLGTITGMFSKKPSILSEEVWSLSVPGDALCSFALRSAIPFILRCHTNKQLSFHQGSPLAVVLYRRVLLRTGQKAKPVAVQLRAVASAQTRYIAEAPGVHRINGIIALPIRCVPSFQTPLITLEYFLGVQRSRDRRIVAEQPVTLSCLPSPIPPQAPFGPYPGGYVKPEMLLESDIAKLAAPVHQPMDPSTLPSPRRPSLAPSTASASQYSSARSHPAAEGSINGAPASVSSRSWQRSSASAGVSSPRDGFGTMSPSPTSTRQSSPAPSAPASPSRPSFVLPPVSIAAAAGTVARPRPRQRATKKGEAQRDAEPDGSRPRVPSKESGTARSALFAARSPDESPSESSQLTQMQEQRGGRYSSRGAAANASILAGIPVERNQDRRRVQKAREATLASTDENRTPKSTASSVTGSHSSVSEKEGEAKRHRTRKERGRDQRAVGDYVSVSSASKTRRRAEVEATPVVPLVTETSERSRRRTQADASAAIATTRSSEPRQAGERKGRRPNEARTASVPLPLPPIPASESALPLPPMSSTVSVPAGATTANGATGFTEDDLLTYGDEMEFDLPPSYFEATAEDL